MVLKKARENGMDLMASLTQETGTIQRRMGMEFMSGRMVTSTSENGISALNKVLGMTSLGMEMSMRDHISKESFMEEGGSNGRMA